MIGGADFQAVQPSIEILNVPAKVAVAELDRIHRTLDLEAGEGATECRAASAIVSILIGTTLICTMVLDIR